MNFLLSFYILFRVVKDRKVTSTSSSSSLSVLSSLTEGQLKGDPTHLGGCHHLEEAAPEQLVPDPPAEETTDHMRHP